MEIISTLDILETSRQTELTLEYVLTLQQPSIESAHIVKEQLSSIQSTISKLETMGLSKINKMFYQIDQFLHITVMHVISIA